MQGILGFRLHGDVVIDCEHELLCLVINCTLKEVITGGALIA